MGWLETPGEILDPTTTRDGHEVTGGDYATEASACAAFDALAECDGWFRVHREVSGEYLYRRPAAGQSQPRIDRILVPTAKALELGWSLGFVGIEIKKSGVKLGPVVAQCMDYANACWRMTNGCRYMTEWVFIFPAASPRGSLASLMAQLRIGAAGTRPLYPRHLGDSLLLQGGSCNVLSKDSLGYSFKSPVCGNRVGSR